MDIIAMRAGRRLRAVALWGVLGLTAVSSHASAASPAETLVREQTDKVMGVLHAEQARLADEPEIIYKVVDEYIAPHFDLDRMSRRVLGKYWRAATDEQRARFIQEFRTLLTRTYATALREYSDETVSFLPSTLREDRNEISVRTQINLSDGPAIPITYEMYADGDVWKVYDVSIEGVSLVINYRSTFAAEVRKGGIEGLIARLEEHNKERASR